MSIDEWVSFLNWLVYGGGALLAIGLWRKQGKDSKQDKMQTNDAFQVLKAQYQDEQYKPYSDEAKRLFAAAAPYAQVPATWSTKRELHRLLEKESAGWVGIPNYTYGQGNAAKRFGSDISKPRNRDRWVLVHNELKQGIVGARSTATGLGQLLLGNTKKYYPEQDRGIGDALNEAVGFLAYVKDRYRTPERALAFHDDKGWY